MRYTVEVNEHGTFWFKEGTKILHRVGGPAKIYVDGLICYYCNNLLHRLDGPARYYTQYPNSEVEYYIMGKPYSKDDYKSFLESMSDITNNPIIINDKKYKLVEAK